MSRKYLAHLFEQEEKPKHAPENDVFVSGNFKARKSMHSVDDQIDALILRYENSSIEEDNKNNLMESLSKQSLRFLFEQEEEGEGDESAPEEDDAEGDSPAGSEKMKASKPAEQLIPNLNIDKFAARSVRLINNPTTLLNLQTAIVNRIKNFLNENYGDEFVTRYIDILEKEFGIEIEEFNTSNMDQTSNDVFAVGANASGTGAG